MSYCEALYFREVFLKAVFLLTRKSLFFPVSGSTPISERIRRARFRGIPRRLAVSASESGLKSSFVGRVAIFRGPRFDFTTRSVPYFTTGSTIREANFPAQYTRWVAGTKSCAFAR